MTAAGAISGLYATIGAVLVGLCVVRLSRRRYVAAVGAFMVASLVWRLALLWFDRGGNLPAWLSTFAMSHTVIFVQLWITLVALLVLMLIEAHE